MINQKIKKETTAPSPTDIVWELDYDKKIWMRQIPLTGGALIGWALH